jgi:hypothetical protein
MTPIPRNELNAVMAEHGDHWPADADLSPQAVREYAQYMRTAAQDPDWPNLSPADRASNLAQADALDALVDRIEAQR